MLQLWRSVNKQVCMGHWDTLGDWDSPISLRRVHFIADNSSDETAAEPDTMCLPALVFSARWARGGRHLATFLRHIFRRPRWSYLTSTGTLYNLSLTTVGVSLLSVCLSLLQDSTEAPLMWLAQAPHPLHCTQFFPCYNDFVWLNWNDFVYLSEMSLQSWPSYFKFVCL